MQFISDHSSILTARGGLLVKKLARLSMMILTLGFGSVGMSHAATTVISQPIFTSLADFSDSNLGQSFTVNGDYFITAINLYISASAGGSDITLRLYDFDSLTSKLGNVILGSGILFETSLTRAAAWETVAFSSPVGVSVGKMYAFTIVAKDPGGSATGWNNYSVSSTSVYAAGNHLNFGPGNAVDLRNSDLSFQVMAVPEPSSSMLIAIAFIAISGRRTRYTLTSRKLVCAYGSQCGTDR